MGIGTGGKRFRQREKRRGKRRSELEERKKETLDGERKMTGGKGNRRDKGKKRRMI